MFTEAGPSLLGAAWWNSVTGMARKPEKKPKAAHPATEAEPGAADDGTHAKPASGVAGPLMLCPAGPVSSPGMMYPLTPAPAAATTTGTPTCLPDGETPIVKTAAKPGQICTTLAKVMRTSGSALARRYLKMDISITSDANGAKAFKDAKPMLVDALNTHVRSIEMADLEHPGLYNRMQERLIRRAELVLGSEVKNGAPITQLPFR